MAVEDIILFIYSLVNLNKSLLKPTRSRIHFFFTFHPTPLLLSLSFSRTPFTGFWGGSVSMNIIESEAVDDAAEITNAVPNKAAETRANEI